MKAKLLVASVILLGLSLGAVSLFCAGGWLLSPLHRGSVSARQTAALLGSAEAPFAEQNALFAQTEGWIGADGAYSVALGPGRTLWLFSDTWVGSVRDGKRCDATIVNNSAAIQEGQGKSATIRFFVARGSDGQPRALISPKDGRGWFWLQAGAVAGGKLVVFLSQIESTGEPGVFGFRQIGQWIGLVDNPLEEPTSWRVSQIRLPYARFDAGREVTFGAALLQSEGILYVYGTDEDIRPGSRERFLILSRVPANKVADFAAWEFFHDGEWSRDFDKASRLVPDMASECSVTYLPECGQYVLVYTERGLSERVLARTAAAPWGLWSDPETIYRCPEAGWDPRVLCYAAKAHGSLSSKDELVFSYVANSSDFWHVAADARLYWPRFVRLSLQPGSTGRP